MVISGSSAAETGARPQSRAAIGHALHLHRLSLAAIRNRDEAQIIPHCVDVHEKALRVRHHAARAVEPPQLAMFDFVYATRRNTKILARLSDRGDLTAAYVIAVLDLADYPLGRSLARHEERVGHSNERDVPYLAGARRTVGLDAECRGGRARVQEAAKHAAFDIDHPPSRRTLVVVQVVAVAVESRVRASPQEGRADGPANFVLFERAQEPASPCVRGLHLERAVRFRRMTDDLMRDERIEMRVGHDNDFTLGRLEDGRSGELLRFLCEVEREGMQVRVGHQLVAPSVCEAFEAALLADRIVGFLVAVGGLRDDIAIALRERESLRDERAGRIDEKLFAQFAHRGNYVESDIRA